jgi:hypothetical protein
MKQVPTRLGQILLAQKTITEKQLANALDYQALHGEPIGHCLVSLGYIEKKVLNRALRRQSWLKPCAACLTCLCAPFTFSPCYANESEEENLDAYWVEQQDSSYGSWSETSALSGNTLAGIDLIKIAAEAAWDMYQGEAKAGEWQYSLSKKSSGYAISMQVHF